MKGLEEAIAYNEGKIKARRNTISIARNSKSAKENEIIGKSVEPNLSNGRWIVSDYGCYCSCCSKWVEDFNRSEDCPACGAKMDGTVVKK